MPARWPASEKLMARQTITAEYTGITEKGGHVVGLDFSVLSVYSVVRFFKLSDYQPRCSIVTQTTSSYSNLSIIHCRTPNCRA